MWNANGTLIGSAPVSARQQPECDNLLGENFAVNCSYFNQLGVQYEAIFYVNLLILLFRQDENAFDDAFRILSIKW